MDKNEKIYLEIRSILGAINISLDDYLKLDKDVRISLLRSYWNSKEKSQEDKEKKQEDIVKTKLLGFFKRK